MRTGLRTPDSKPGAAFTLGNLSRDGVGEQAFSEQLEGVLNPIDPLHRSRIDNSFVPHRTSAPVDPSRGNDRYLVLAQSRIPSPVQSGIEIGIRCHDVVVDRRTDPSRSLA